jgi:hypothetical protein
MAAMLKALALTMLNKMAAPARAEMYSTRKSRGASVAIRLN